jgi:hypothetical protein
MKKVEALNKMLEDDARNGGVPSKAKESKLSTLFQEWKTDIMTFDSLVAELQNMSFNWFEWVKLCIMKGVHKYNFKDGAFKLQGIDQGDHRPSQSAKHLGGIIHDFASGKEKSSRSLRQARYSSNAVSRSEKASTQRRRAHLILIRRTLEGLQR